MFHADGNTNRWTDGQTGRYTYMTKLIIALRNFPKVPKFVYEAFLLIVCGAL